MGRTTSKAAPGAAGTTRSSLVTAAQAFLTLRRPDPELPTSPFKSSRTRLARATLKSNGESRITR
ncbi:hypothetical protein [Streptomyces sp. 2A115]|uniref:hypothetical protein n=1 Tax=Streptomyces sp. 2A115 TaxID=3457439 RepID=UPI003FD1213F